MTFETNTQHEITLKSGKHGVVGLIKSVKYLSESSVVCFMENNSFKVVDCETRKKVHRTQQIGFMCNFCVNFHPNQKRLLQEHTRSHYGPVECEICKVSA